MKTVQKIIITFGFIIMGNVTFAHPPKNISAVYDPGNEEITIFVEHYSSEPHTHYVEVISISDEKGILNTQSFMDQTSNDKQVYKMTLKGKKPGDSIEINCKCNKFGKKRKTVVLETV